MEECQICFIFNESYISLSCCNKQLCSNCLSKVNFCPYCRAEIKKLVAGPGFNTNDDANEEEDLDEILVIKPEIQQKIQPNRITYISPNINLGTYNYKRSVKSSKKKKSSAIRYAKKSINRFKKSGANIYRFKKSGANMIRF